MTGNAAEGTNGDASARKRCPERVTIGAGEGITVPSSCAVELDGSVGATGRGGRTMECSTVVVTEFVLAGCLNKNGSRSSETTLLEPAGSSGNGREGLSGRHSSSKVIERLERTVRVAGK